MKFFHKKTSDNLNITNIIFLRIIIFGVMILIKFVTLTRFDTWPLAIEALVSRGINLKGCRQ